MAVAVKKYNPGFLSDNEIIASFCVRTAEFDSLVESLRESDAGSSPHSLVIGPRGSGKTHLLLRVAAEVRRNPALTGLFPITFAEESYEVTTCGEFWLECLGRLADQAPGEARDNLRLTYDDLRTVTDDQALADRCIGSLLDFADRQQTRLLLLVENLNMLFDDINDPDVGWRLRQPLQTEPRFILFGSATSRFDEIDNPDHALYDLFRIITLHPLDTAECEALWESVAGKPSTTNAVRPLEILTGGNPRLLTIIARFGADRSFRDLMENLLDLVDEHTEYFKSHLEALPSQERRVYLSLARLWKPSTTREIADQARLNTSTCSAQLKRLVSRGSVAIEGGTPRRRQYYLTERLYNIYYLLRRGTGADRLVQALIDFMICLYSTSELVEIIDKFRANLHDSSVLDGKVAEKMLELLLNQAKALGRSGETDKATDLYDQVIQQLDSDSQSSHNHQIANALASKCVLLFNAGRWLDAIQACDEIISRFGRHSESRLAFHVAYALTTKGMALAEIDDPTQAMFAFDQSLAKLSDLDEHVPRFLVSGTLLAKGSLLFQAKRLTEVLQVSDQVISLYTLGEEVEVDINLPFAIIYKSAALDLVGRTISEGEFSALLNLMEMDGSLLPASIEALIPYVAGIKPDKALGLLQDSPTAHLLQPLTTALQQEMGHPPHVAKEVAEVASDVRVKLAEARARQARARAQDQPS